MGDDIAEAKVRVIDGTANPDALGAMLLGWVTVLLALSALGVYPLGGMVISTIFFSGFGFMLVAYIGYERGEAFTLFAFGAIAVFVWAFAGFNLLPGLGIVPAPVPNEIGAFMIVFSIFVAVFALITMKMPCRLLSVTIFSASLLFLMVGIHAIVGGEALMLAYGAWAMVVGTLSLYLGSATALNSVTGRIVAPIWLCRPK